MIYGGETDAKTMFFHTTVIREVQLDNSLRTLERAVRIRSASGLSNVGAGAVRHQRDGDSTSIWGLY